MIKVLLLENEEYYPIATTININGELRPLLYDDGDENPLSSDLIEKFDEILEDKINQAEFRAFANRVSWTQGQTQRGHERNG